MTSARPAKSGEWLTCTRSEFGYDSREDSNIQYGIQLLWYIFYSPSEIFTDSCATTFCASLYSSTESGIFYICYCAWHRSPVSRAPEHRWKETESLYPLNISPPPTTTTRSINKNILWFMPSGLCSTFENTYSCFSFTLMHELGNSFWLAVAVAAFGLQKIRWQERSSLTVAERKMPSLI